MGPAHPAAGGQGGREGVGNEDCRGSGEGEAPWGKVCKRSMIRKNRNLELFTLALFCPGDVAVAVRGRGAVVDSVIHGPRAHQPALPGVGGLKVEALGVGVAIGLENGDFSSGCRAGNETKVTRQDEIETAGHKTRHKTVLSIWSRDKKSRDTRPSK